MKKYCGFIIVLVLACLAMPINADCGGTGEPLTVVCLGDSTTALRSGVVVYATNLANELPLAGINSTVYNKGIGGNRTDQGLARLQNDVLNYAPNLVIIQFGINDSWLDSGVASVTGGVVTGDPSRLRYNNTDGRGYVLSASYYLDNLTSIVQRTKAIPANPRIIIMTPNQLSPTGQPAWRNEVLGVYAEQVRQIAASESVDLLDVWQMYTDYHAVPGQSMDDLLKDTMHPNTLGHRMLTDALYMMLGIDPLGDPVLPDPLVEKDYSQFDVIYDFEGVNVTSGNNALSTLDTQAVLGQPDFTLDARYPPQEGDEWIANGIWTLDTGMTSLGSASGGRWYVAGSGSAAGTGNEAWANSGLSYEGGWSAEIRIKVIAGEEIGGRSFEFVAGPAGTSLRGHLLVGESQSGSVGNLRANNNTDDFHVFRIASGPCGSPHGIWRDGKLIWIGLHGSSGGAGPALLMGDTSSQYGGKVEIDYIAWTQGGFAPLDAVNCDSFLAGDINQDCFVNLKDIVLMAAEWLDCTDPANPDDC